MSEEFMKWTEFRVRYQETDQMNVVYYANYLVWFEIGRNELFRELEIPYTFLEEKSIYIPVVKAECEYKHPARYDDLVIVYTKISKLTPAQIKFGYWIYRKEHSDNSERLLAVGSTSHAFVDETGKPISLSKKLPDTYQEIAEKAK